MHCCLQHHVLSCKGHHLLRYAYSGLVIGAHVHTHLYMHCCAHVHTHLYMHCAHVHTHLYMHCCLQYYVYTYLYSLEVYRIA
ncbi:hypothetical protein VOLCADRAFT_75422 [Volvox carteri f. nagariensis]|uniref:Uncharacterized protein n=1 Tax=Volvox carteri f. nagariensis TaxID=3068 RepID=D8U1N6_VOLCA|nr:uncharacterized protein VOLCADRAFT_75422 [Volvox carteri f. nagariensis]EFJ46371.1 hypothetical protein VOLCADRAFT_75422 [Volvox carteri f. nagariensis]|eukprot:XP_002952524.1 hypothetical protein VOLCADRAFT_75422 [Volvox carteri f. nagariensis]